MNMDFQLRVHRYIHTQYNPTFYKLSIIQSFLSVSCERNYLCCMQISHFKNLTNYDFVFRTVLVRLNMRTKIIHSTTTIYSFHEKYQCDLTQPAR